MDNAYKSHLDNIIHNYDNDIKKQQNIITVPIFKGLGYSITYDKNNEMDYQGEKKRDWWSDYLHNKDDILLAGQDILTKFQLIKKFLL